MEDLVRHKKRRHESEATNPWDWEEEKTKQRKKQTTQEEIDFCVYSCPFPDGREKDVVYIHASKTRIIEIYNNLELGIALDGRGYPIN